MFSLDFYLLLDYSLRNTNVLLEINDSKSTHYLETVGITFVKKILLLFIVYLDIQEDLCALY